MSTLAKIIKMLKARRVGEPAPDLTKRQIFALLDDDDRLLDARIPEEELIEHPFFGEGADALNRSGLALRYEIARGPRWDITRHYDAAGGMQAKDIARNIISNIEQSSEKPIKNREKLLARSQFRISPLEGLRARWPHKLKFEDGDPYMGWSGGGPGRDYLRSPVVYPNEAEGYAQTAGVEFDPADYKFPFEGFLDEKRFFRDPDYRLVRNASISVPYDHPFHRKAKIAKAEGGEIKPTTQNSALGMLAAMLRSGRDFANKAEIPVLGGVGDLLLGKTPEEIEDWSYGNSPFDRGYSGIGDRLPRIKPRRKEQVADTLTTLPGLIPMRVAPAAAKFVGREALRRMDNAMITGQGPLAQLAGAARPMTAVRPRGGNVNEARLAGYLQDQLDVLTPEYFDYVGDPQAAPRRIPEIDEWGSKQLKNYLKKDLGAPTDPLLEVEKEFPGLHLPENRLRDEQPGVDIVNGLRYGADLSDPVYGNMSDRMRTHFSNYAKKHFGLTDKPLTPWGRYSDAELYAANPLDYANEITGQSAAKMADLEEGALPGALEWLRKAPEDTKIWGLVTPQEDALGFNHVLDYLEQATEPAKWAKEYVNPEEVPFWNEGLRDLVRAGAAANTFEGRKAVADALAARYKGTKNEKLAARAAESLNMNPLRTDHLQRLGRLQEAGLTLDPESLKRLSVADAVKKTAQWNEFLAAQRTADGSLSKGWKEFKAYPDKGMKWVEFGRPDFPKGADEAGRLPVEGGRWQDSPEVSAIREGLRAEGDEMGHCVGGYCDDVLNRGTKIYSLRDAKGRPHVTIEVRPQYTGSFDSWFDNMPEDMYRVYVDEFLAKNPGYKTAPNGEPIGKEWKDHLRELYGNKPQTYEIVQIKGKQNAAPVAEYLPFVQDFVKSGKWGRVGDLRNTGLVKYKDVYDTPENLWKMVDEHPRYKRMLENHRLSPYPSGSAGRGIIENRDMFDPATALELLDDPKFNLTEYMSGRPRYKEGGVVAAPERDPPGFLPRGLGEWVTELERLYAAAP